MYWWRYIDDEVIDWSGGDSNDELNDVLLFIRFDHGFVAIFVECVAGKKFNFSLNFYLFQI